MSLEKTKEFFNMVETDETFREAYKSLLAGCNDFEEDEVMSRIEGFASEKGFEITADDIRSAATDMEGGELTDEELKEVAGGGASVSWYILGDANFQGGQGRSTFCIIVGWAQSE